MKDVGSELVTAPVLTLKCPHCFVPLILRDRTLVNRRTVCPKCDELMHLAADPDRVVVGILPSRHNAHALTVHGVLEFPENAPGDPHKVLMVATPVRVERTLEEVLAHAPPVEPRRPLQAIDFPIEEPVELAEIAKGSAVRKAPRTETPTPKKRPVAPPATEVRKPVTPRPAAPRRVVEVKAAVPAPSADPTPATVPDWRDRLRGFVDARSWLAWVQQNLKLVLVAGVLVLLLIAQLLWMLRGSNEGAPAAAPASASKDPSRDSQTLPTVVDRQGKSSSGKGVPDAESSRAGTAPNDPLAEVLPAPAGTSDADDRGPQAIPETDPDRPDAPAVAEVPRETPATIIVAPEKPKRDLIDVAARLRQPLSSFDQPRPVSARSLFESLEEMIGVPVLMDAKDLGASAGALDQKVTLKLKSTTVGDLLQAVADRTGLQWQIDGESIRLRAKSSP